MKNISGIIVLVVLLAGCATPYHPPATTAWWAVMEEDPIHGRVILWAETQTACGWARTKGGDMARLSECRRATIGVGQSYWVFFAPDVTMMIAAATAARCDYFRGMLTRYGRLS